MIRNKLHSHNVAFNRSFFFQATRAELGLDNRAWIDGMTPPEGCRFAFTRYRDQGCRSMAVRKMGFDDSEAFEKYIFEKLALTQDAYRQNRSWTSQMADWANEAQETPKLVCEAHGARIKVRDAALSKDFWYDRRAPVCCKPWHFHDGDDYTVVSFFNKITEPLGPSSPDKIPEETAMHIHWIMSFAEPDGESRYRINEHRHGEPIDLRLVSREYWLEERRGEIVEKKKKEHLALLQRQPEGRPELPSTGNLRMPSAARIRTDYVPIIGEVILFLFGLYIAHKCSSASQPLTSSAPVYAKCCPPCVPRMKIKHVQYNTV